MKRNQKLPAHNTLDNLANTIEETDSYFLNKVQKQVNTALTLRNWVIGYYIVDYEQSGKDRAEYGKQLFKAIAEKLLKKGFKSITNGNSTYVRICIEHILKFCGHCPQNCVQFALHRHLSNLFYTRFVRRANILTP